MLFDWDYDNIVHLAQHDILPAEAEGVLMRGTHMTLVTTERTSGLRIVTGWDTTKSERIAYLKSLR